MSITYSKDISFITTWTFLKLIFKWRGSVYKVVWVESLIMIILSLIISITFHYWLTEVSYPKTFYFMKLIIVSCKEAYTRIPISFVLGFYVSLVITRWYDQLNIIPWPDEVALLISAYITGTEERVIMLRRQIIRYLNATFIMAASYFFDDVRKLFPTEQDYVKSGFLSNEELKKITEADVFYSKYFIPSNWAQSLVYKAYKENLISSDILLDSLINKISDYRGAVGAFFLIDQVNPPLVYTQVAGFCVYVYIYGSVIAFQNIDNAEDGSIKSHVKVFYPSFEMLIFIFYLAWYKVAESLMNPFGKSSYNFDIIYYIQRNLQVSYLYVDTLTTNNPSIFPADVVDNQFDFDDIPNMDQESNRSVLEFENVDVITDIESELDEEISISQ